MNRLSETMWNTEREDVIALFGRGRLVRISRLRLELRGGTREDELEAQSWVSMFMPESILAGRQCGCSA